MDISSSNINEKDGVCNCKAFPFYKIYEDVGKIYEDQHIGGEFIPSKLHKCILISY
jgi:hypothetical protein